MPHLTAAYAAHAADKPLEPWSFDRRDVLPDDVRIEIDYCGVCHSDLHQARNEWGGSTFPIVPGHEIIGHVVEVGSDVSRFKVGDTVGVGVMVGSCQACERCKGGEEQYCLNGFTETYNSPDPHGTTPMTYGGYSTQVVCDQHFVFSIPDALDIKAAAPLLCAGITTYSPLRHWRVEEGMKVGVVGLGGLGHMGLQFAAAMGAETVLFTTSPGKEADAKAMGAHEVVISKDADAMAQHAASFDFILNTVSASHDLDAYMQLLKVDGAMCLVGIPEHPHTYPQVGTLLSRRSLTGSSIGSVKETQEMLQFCADKGIACKVEMIDMQDIETAYDRMLKSDVKYRFVIDMASLK